MFIDFVILFFGVNIYDYLNSLNIECNMFLLWYFEIFNENMLFLKVIYVNGVNNNFFNCIFNGNLFLFIFSIVWFLVKFNYGNLIESLVW